MSRADRRFSFVVSNYNYERYLDQCLSSLSGQKFDPARFEIVCVDDGSTDASAAIIARHKAKTPNFTDVFIPNSGLEKAVNMGIRRARFDCIIRVDADDFLDPLLLSKMDQMMEAEPQWDFYYCRNFVEFYSPEENFKKELPDFDAAEVMARGDFFATGTVYRKSQLAEIGYFPEDVKNCGLENYAVILKLIARGRRGRAVPGASFAYRRHRVNMSNVKRQAIIDYGKRLLRSYGREYRTNQYHPYGLKLDSIEAAPNSASSHEKEM